MKLFKMSVLILLVLLICCSCGNSKGSNNGKIHDIWDVVNYGKSDIKKVMVTELNGKNNKAEIPDFLGDINGLKFKKKLNHTPTDFKLGIKYTVTLSDNTKNEISFDNKYIRIIDNSNKIKWYQQKELNPASLNSAKKTDNNISSKDTVEGILDFSIEDILKVNITYSDTTQSISTVEFMGQIQEIAIDKKLKHTPDVGNIYDDYKVVLSDHRKYELKEYDNYLKITNKWGLVSWYEITINTDPLRERMKKPVIYLYPKHSMEVLVDLDITGKLTYTYPAYHNGWQVTADPDGTLHNAEDGKTYSYLFWEGLTNTRFDLSKGFVVKGSDTTEFLQKKLEYMGLTSKEYNDFIVYWAPKMSENPYNFITFQDKAYTEAAKLTITPKPDSILRVFMVYQPLEADVDVPEQKLIQWDRKGFSVVEWGGTQIQ